MNERLLKFVKANNRLGVQSVLRKGADIHYKNGSALYVAVWCGFYDMAAFLLSQKACANARNGAALIHAVRFCRPEMADLLLTHGADPDVQKGEALVYAATAGDIKKVESLIRHGANPRVKNNLPLGRAMYHAHPEIVEILVEAGADIFVNNHNVPLRPHTDEEETIKTFLSEEETRQRALFQSDMASASDLRGFLKAGWRNSGEPALIRAMRMDVFPAIRDEMAKRGIALDVVLLTGVKNTGNETALDIAAEKGLLTDVFQPPLWRGDVAAMHRCFSTLSPAVQAMGGMTAHDFGAVIARYRRERITQNARPPRIG